MVSPTEENYLKAIYLLQEKTTAKPVSTNDISFQLETSAASVTDMMKRLADKKLIHYKKYQGVLLTTAGNMKAMSIIRKHRLWELFLVSKLKFQWDEVHTVAEELEHVNSELLISKLDRFLDYPKFDPHGDPIPNRQGKIITGRFKNLCELRIKDRGKVAGVIEQQPSFLKQLDKLNIHMGTPIKVTDKMEFDKSMGVTINNHITVNISHDIAKNILIAK
ncbi:MAG: metal-dependent transcriptional regulator [Chitinophagales bacterium]|nr:metal-dependent transcriptional regulator [Chitinophagales bacterium]